MGLAAGRRISASHGHGRGPRHHAHDPASSAAPDTAATSSALAGAMRTMDYDLNHHVPARPSDGDTAQGAARLLRYIWNCRR